MITIIDYGMWNVGSILNMLKRDFSNIKMNRKVFIGLVDIASFIGDWDFGFKENNYATLKGSINYQLPIQNSKLDFIIQKTTDRVGYFKPGRISIRVKPWWDKKVREYYFTKAINECDIFLFFWDSFYLQNADYKILKEKGKKIITVFVGDDVRWEPAMKQEFKMFKLPIIEYKNYDYSISSLNRKLNFLRVAEKYSDVILSQPNATQLSLRPYHNLHIPIVLNDYKERNQQRQKPIIIHAPTSIGKGTHYIEPIIEQLRNESFIFEYQRIQNIPREKAIEIYSNADIIIDQLLIPGGGKLAHEGLAMGKVVLTLMANNIYNQKKPSDCPLVDVRAENLSDVLKQLIPDVNLRSEIAAKGRPYIGKHHSPKKIVNDILNKIDNKTFCKPDYEPTFFRGNFIPESEESIDIYNKSTDFVKDCDWYKKHIATGERDGLFF